MLLYNDEDGPTARFLLSKIYVLTADDGDMGVLAGNLFGSGRLIGSWLVF